MIEIFFSNDFVTVDQDIMGGTPVFSGTRIPIKILFDYLQTGHYDIQDFLNDFSTLDSEKVLGLLKEISNQLSTSQLVQV